MSSIRPVLSLLPRHPDPGPFSPTRKSILCHPEVHSRLSRQCPRRVRPNQSLPARALRLLGRPYCQRVRRMRSSSSLYVITLCPVLYLSRDASNVRRSHRRSDVASPIHTPLTTLISQRSSVDEPTSHPRSRHVGAGLDPTTRSRYSLNPFTSTTYRHSRPMIRGLSLSSPTISLSSRKCLLKTHVH